MPSIIGNFFLAFFFCYKGRPVLKMAFLSKRFHLASTMTEQYQGLRMLQNTNKISLELFLA